MRNFEPKPASGGYMSKTGQDATATSGIRRRFARTTLRLIILLGLGAASIHLAHAQTYREHVLYNFTAGADGGRPKAGLIIDHKGNLYGTTFSGGSSGQGTVFKVNSKSGKETVLWNFCPTGYPCPTDGAQPVAGVIVDATGNLYGTTTSSPGSNWGMVYKLSKSGKETVLNIFTKAGGEQPLGGVIFDAQGNLYGTTIYGGDFADNCWSYLGCGVVFKVDARTGAETVLYSFTGGADGNQPSAGLVMDSEGNLYGTTYYGGTGLCNDGNFTGCGVVFKLDPTTGKETVLHSFAGYPNDGNYPYAPVIWDAQEKNLYGTTSNGGTYTRLCPAGCGTVFKVSKSGDETVLYSFGGRDRDIGNPEGSLIMDASGNVYGATNSGCGMVFKVSKSGRETILHSFTRRNDGCRPTTAGLAMDATGNLYGTTQYGGTSGYGTVFKMSK